MACSRHQHCYQTLQTLESLYLNANSRTFLERQGDGFACGRNTIGTDLESMRRTLDGLSKVPSVTVVIAWRLHVLPEIVPAPKVVAAPLAITRA